MLALRKIGRWLAICIFTIFCENVWVCDNICVIAQNAEWFDVKRCTINFYCSVNYNFHILIYYTIIVVNIYITLIITISFSFCIDACVNIFS